MHGGVRCERTFILAQVFEGEGQAGVFALDDADLAKGALADDAEEFEVVELDCGHARSAVEEGGAARSGLTLVGEDDGPALRVAHARGGWPARSGG